MIMTADRPAPQSWPELGGELDSVFPQRFMFLNHSPRQSPITRWAGPVYIFTRQVRRADKIKWAGAHGLNKKSS